MPLAKSGDTVKVHYKGTLADGTEFDSSLDREPFVFTLGENMVIPGFENAIIGMEVGETKSVTIPSDDAYGPYRQDLVVEIENTVTLDGNHPLAGQDLTFEIQLLEIV